MRLGGGWRWGKNGQRDPPFHDKGAPPQGGCGSPPPKAPSHSQLMTPPPKDKREEEAWIIIIMLRKRSLRVVDGSKWPQQYGGVGPGTVKDEAGIKGTIHGTIISSDQLKTIPGSVSTLASIVRKGAGVVRTMQRPR